MVRLKADFEADGTAYLRRLITRVWGAEVGRISNQDIPVYYFESFRRRLAPQHRLLKVAGDFRCASEDETGWQAFQDKIRDGEDLNPHLSQRHVSLFNRDALLAEWGVHHFHLGTEPDPKDPRYIKRTCSLVLGLVDGHTFCAINIVSHGLAAEPPWADERIVGSIHRNWPDMISRYRAIGVTGMQLDKTQRQKYRRGNVNTIIQTQDGTSYLPLAGGVSAAGVNMETNMQADRWLIEIRWLQTEVERKIPELVPVFEQQGYRGESEIKAELRITETGYQIFYPRYQVLSTIHPRG